MVSCELPVKSSQERFVPLQAHPTVRKILFWTIDNQYSTTYYSIIP